MIVISLGGSVIISDKVNYKFLKEFKKFILSLKKEKIVIVTGGGSTARKYINALHKIKADKKVIAFTGIAATRTNAKFLYNFFGLKFYKIPHSLKQVKNLLKRNNIVICGALRYEENHTSDGTAAEIARYVKADYFINITNVKGLYNKDPNEYKNAKLIKKIRFNDFYKITQKIKFKAGQHFILDNIAAKIIKQEKIKTYIIKNNINTIKKIIKGKPFTGTLIS